MLGIHFIHLPQHTQCFGTRGQAGRTQIIKKIRLLKGRHNLQWSLPTKTFPTREALAWVSTELSLPTIDRLEMDYLIVDLEQMQQRILDSGSA